MPTRRSAWYLAAVALVVMIVLVILPLTLRKRVSVDEDDDAVANKRTNHTVANDDGVLTETTPSSAGGSSRDDDDDDANAPSALALVAPPTSSPTKTVAWRQIGDGFHGGRALDDASPSAALSLGGRLVWSSGDGALACRAFDERAGSWVLRRDLSENFESPVLSVAATPDGRTVVAGAPREEKALVFFNEDPSDADGLWTPRGDVVTSGSITGVPEYFGGAVDVTDDGDTVVVSSRFDQYVRLFAYRGTDWVLMFKLGDAVTGWLSIGYGTSLAISGDGSRLLVGAERCCNGESYTGAVFAYEVAEEMITFKQRMMGNKPADGFGKAVSLSRDGSIAAVGTNRNVREYAGHRNNGDYVRVYKRNDGDDEGNLNYYVPVSEDIKQDNTALFGASVALSGDGRRLAVGSLSRASSAGVAPAKTFGKAFVYSINDAAAAVNGWVMIGEFEREWVAAPLSTFDDVPTSVAVSDDGRRIVVGSTIYDDVNASDTVMMVFESSPDT